ncbi:hypothetical protein ACFQ38_16290 [Sporosarcina contaminans]|uniref:Uncharacterized protein n=1 Tax=Sporosarcina contaminans TaxID=633403 RepID=A0ABW3U1Y4_9BACL
MPKYRMYGVLDATKYLGEVEAENKEQAEEKAWESDEQHVSICHHCSGEFDLGDMIRVIVEEVEE